MMFVTDKFIEEYEKSYDSFDAVWSTSQLQFWKDVSQTFVRPKIEKLFNWLLSEHYYVDDPCVFDQYRAWREESDDAQIVVIRKQGHKLNTHVYIYHKDFLVILLCSKKQWKLLRKQDYFSLRWDKHCIFFQDDKRLINKNDLSIIRALMNLDKVLNK